MDGGAGSSHTTLHDTGTGARHAGLEAEWSTAQNKELTSITHSEVSFAQHYYDFKRGYCYTCKTKGLKINSFSVPVLNGRSLGGNCLRDHTLDQPEYAPQVSNEKRKNSRSGGPCRRHWEGLQLRTGERGGGARVAGAEGSGREEVMGADRGSHAFVFLSLYWGP